MQKVKNLFRGGARNESGEDAKRSGEGKDNIPDLEDAKDIKHNDDGTSIEEKNWGDLDASERKIAKDKIREEMRRKIEEKYAKDKKIDARIAEMKKDKLDSDEPDRPYKVGPGSADFWYSNAEATDGSAWMLPVDIAFFLGFTYCNRHGSDYTPLLWIVDDDADVPRKDHKVDCKHGAAPVVIMEETCNRGHIADPVQFGAVSKSGASRALQASGERISKLLVLRNPSRLQELPVGALSSSSSFWGRDFYESSNWLGSECYIGMQRSIKSLFPKRCRGFYKIIWNPVRLINMALNCMFWLSIGLVGALLEKFAKYKHFISL
eukprot:jgi/Bigna1/71264/fgenesh1_pg.15_\